MWYTRSGRVKGVLALCGVTVLMLMASVMTFTSLPAVASAHASYTSLQSSSPSLTLVSPTSGQGPVGAHVTVSGNNWSTSSVSIGAAQSASACASSSSWQTTFGTQQVSGSSFTYTFIWPSSLSSGQYYLCAIDASGSSSATPTTQAGISADQPFSVRSGSPPALSLSTAFAQAGRPVTITGTNFFGAPSGASVSVLLLSNGNATTIGQASPGGDGKFTLQYTPSPSTQGNVTIQAQSASEGGAPPALQASVSLSIAPPPSPTATTQATATPTNTVAPVVTPTTTGATPGDQNSGNTGLIILLVVAIGLVLLGLLGLVAFLLLRRRSDGGPDSAYGYDPQNPQGYGGYGQGDSRHMQGVTGRYPQQPGFFGPNDEYGDQGPYPTPPPGRVSQWDAPPAEPGPDWQPRPMTGNRRGSDNPAPYGPDAPTRTEPAQEPYPPQGDPWEQGETANWDGPPDPWASPPGQGRSGPGSGPGGGQAGRPPTNPPRDPWNNPGGDDW